MKLPSKCTSLLCRVPSIQLHEITLLKGYAYILATSCRQPGYHIIKEVLNFTCQCLGELCSLLLWI